MSFSRHLGVSAVLLLLLTLLTDPVWGFYEGFAAILMSGTVTDGPLTDFYFYGGEPLGKLLAPLHLMLTHWPWLGVAFCISLLFSVALSSWVMGHLIDRCAGRPQGTVLSWATPLFIVPCYGFVITEYSGSSVGFLTSASAVLGIWHITAKAGDPVRWGRVAMLSFFYITAYFYRIDSALGGTFIALLFIGIVAPRPLWPRFRALLLPGAVSVVFLMAIAYAYAQLPFLSQIEPYIYYVTDSRFQPPVSCQNAVDSMKVEAIKYSFFNDTAQLNLALFERLVEQKSEAIASSGGASSRFLPVALSVMAPTMGSNREVTWVFALVLLCTIGLALVGTGWEAMLRLLAFNAMLWGTILVLAYSLKMEKWHYVPMLQTGIMFNLTAMVLFGGAVFGRHHKLTLGLWSVLCLAMLSGIVQDAGVLGGQAASRHALLDRVQSYRGDRVLYVDANAREILNGHVFRMYRPMGKVLLYDQGQLSLIPQYRERLDRICNCRSAIFTEFMGYMKREGSNIMVLSSDGRIDLLSRYASTVHGLDIRFIPEDGFQPFEASGQPIRAYFAAE
jgi:hypothetical protein